MSKTQEQAIKVAVAILIPILTVGIAWGTIRTQLADTVTQVNRNSADISIAKGEIRETRADIRWLVDSNKRIESKLDAEPKPRK